MFAALTTVFSFPTHIQKTFTSDSNGLSSHNCEDLFISLFFVQMIFPLSLLLSFQNYIQGSKILEP